jgi:hypothetical protein
MMFGNGGTCGTTSVGVVSGGGTGTVLLVLSLGVCTTVHESFLTLKTGSMLAPGLYVCVPTNPLLVDCPSPKSSTKLLNAPFMLMV